MPDPKAILTETLRKHRIVITGYRDQPMCCSCQEGCSRNGHMLTMDADEFPAHLADVLLSLPGVAIVDAEVYRVARKGLVDLTEAWAELRMDTPEDQSLHDRLVATSRVAADLLPLPTAQQPTREAHP